jgi:VanZ family protein
MRGVPVPLLPSRLRWGGVVLIGATIGVLSVTTVTPQEPVLLDGPPLDLALDKWRHLVAYAALGGSLAYATADWDWSGRRLAALVIGVAVAYGIGIEGIQAVLPYRYFGLGDAAANTVGSLLVLPWFLCRPWVRLVPVPSVEARG